MSLPVLGDLEDLDGARVLARLDLNVPIKDGIVQDDSRITAALPTLRWLLERVGVVAICSHLGKAKELPTRSIRSGRWRPSSNAPSAERSVLSTTVSRKPTRRPARSCSSRISVFIPGEKANDPEFAARLVASYTHYVNDAFGTAHRAHGSVVAAPALFPGGRKAAGFLIEREVAALRRVVDDPDQPFVAVVGGAKVSTKTAPLEALLQRVRGLLIGGGMANTFLLAKGLPVGRSLVEKDMLDTARRVMELAEERGIALELPDDVVVTDSITDPQRSEVVASSAIPDDLMVVDIGPTARERYAQALAGARTVFWNGPMGVFEVDAFAGGTLAVAEALASSSAFSVVGGGESVMAIRRAGVIDRIDHVSTGGGASLEFITGKDLPALIALEL